MIELLEMVEKSIYSGRAKEATKYTRQQIESGVPWREILNRAMLPALDRVGREYSEGTAFLPEMIAAGMAMTAAVEVIKGHLGGENFRSKGTIVLGTVFDDVHDIGKNIVKLNLEGAGYKVIDLGIDVQPDVFIGSCRDAAADIVGISCLLSTTMANLEKTVAAIRDSDVEIKIMVGGNPVTAEFARRIGADGYAPDGHLAVKKADELVEFRS